MIYKYLNSFSVEQKQLQNECLFEHFNVDKYFTAK